jgi:hypothetical protein
MPKKIKVFNNCADKKNGEVGSGCIGFMGLS